MIHIVDYGLGNIQAFVNMYKRLGIESVRARAAVDLENATKIILPGVGAFDHAMELLAASGMREPLDDLVLAQGVPVLGICVGMQILANSSEEGVGQGLGWVDGRVCSFAGNPASARCRCRTWVGTMLFRQPVRPCSRGLKTMRASISCIPTTSSARILQVSRQGPTTAFSLIAQSRTATCLGCSFTRKRAITGVPRS